MWLGAGGHSLCSWCTVHPSNDQLKFGKHVVNTGPAESWIICQKAKPKGTAELGQAILYYDKESAASMSAQIPRILGRSSLLVNSKGSGHDESL